MKNSKSILAIVIGMVTIAAFLPSCTKTESPNQPASATEMSLLKGYPHSSATNPNSDETGTLKRDHDSDDCRVYPVDANVSGKSYGEWGAAWWTRILSYPCATNPQYDTDGSLQSQGQSGPVYFLAGAPFNTPFTRSVTIPEGKKIFLPLVALEEPYPCTDGDPAPGQSLEDFLYSVAKDLVDGVDTLWASLDGHTIGNLYDYRAHSPMFTFTGNPDVANCIDPCITGTPQPDVTDGYWLLLKTLSPGHHTLHIRAGLKEFLPYHPLLLKDITYNITQRGGHDDDDDGDHHGDHGDSHGDNGDHHGDDGDHHGHH